MTSNPDIGRATLDILRGVGIRVELTGLDQLTFRGPKKAIRELAPILKRYKPILLAAVRGVPPELADGGGWEYRDDAEGRPGWDRSDVKPWECWWRRGSFERLAVPPKRFRFGGPDDMRRE